MIQLEVSLGPRVRDALRAIEALAATSPRRPREGFDRRAEIARVSFRKIARRSLHREARINLVEWTERHRRHGKFSKSPGSRVRIGDLEVTRGPFLWVTEPGVREIGIMACTQSGKTFLMESVAGWVMHTDPGPMLYVGPTIPDAIQFIDEKFMQMVEATPVLKPRINVSRTSGNRNNYKRFPGGRIRGGGTEARGLFTMVADRFLFLDEIDGHENAGGDGDTYLLAKGRTPEYAHNYMMFAVSSPTVKDRGKGLPSIYKIFMSGDQRLPFVQCQGCGHDHFMSWQRDGAKPSLHIPKRDDDERGTFEPNGAAYVCPKCGYAHANVERLRMLRTGAIHWRATRAFRCCGEWQDPQKTWDACEQTAEDYVRIWQPWGEPLGVPAIGFGERGVDRAKCGHCGKLPVPNRIATGNYGRYYRPQFSLAEMAHEFVEVIRDPAKRRAYMNTIQGLPYEDRKAKAITVEHLAEQGERWEIKPPADPDDPFELPEYFVDDAIAAITIGIDVQQGADDGSGSRFAIERVGWGEGEESWSLDYREEPANTRDVREWDRALLPYIEAYQHRVDGRAFRAMAVCIDAGNNPDQAADFVARHQMRLRSQGIHLFAVKGIGDKGATTYRTWAGAAQSAKAFERFSDGSVKLWSVGVREAKDTIAAHLGVPNGPGAVHFPRGRAETWITGLLSEDQVVRGGRAVWEHLRKDVRNEPLDCRVYALAGLRAIQATYPNWSLAWQAKQVGARLASAMAGAPGEYDAAPGDRPFQAAAETAVRLHEVLTAAAQVARESSRPGQSEASEPIAPSKRAADPGTPRIDAGWVPPVNYWD